MRYDENIDSIIVELNSRYQHLIRENNKNEDKTYRYLHNIVTLKIKDIVEDLKYRKYARSNFSTLGNQVVSVHNPVALNDVKIAVYSCIIGKYDKIIEPLFKDANVDYYMITDQPVVETSIWKKIDVTGFDEYNKLNPILLNRKMKILPYDIFQDYDYSVYVDGNIEIVASVLPMINIMGDAGLAVHYHNRRDCIYDESVAVIHYKRANEKLVLQQMKAYREEGFPAHYGLYENSILIRRHGDEYTCDLMKKWWEEYQRFPTRDQFSLPYLVWKMDARNNICILGDDISNNPRINRIQKHLI